MAMSVARSGVVVRFARRDLSCCCSVLGFGDDVD